VEFARGVYSVSAQIVGGREDVDEKNSAKCLTGISKNREERKIVANRLGVMRNTIHNCLRET
jgi:hypothetical protein